VLFCVGHFFIDMYSGALGALQPMLVTSTAVFHASEFGGVLYFLLDATALTAISPTVSYQAFHGAGTGDGWNFISASVLLRIISRCW